MNTIQITLTDTENMSLLLISQATGKAVNDLFLEAIRTLIRQCSPADRRVLLQQARGMWHDRQDIPSADTLRQEWERHNIQA